MTWTFYPTAWNGFADIALNTAVGCSNLACNTRAVCWAKGLTRRGFGDCAECNDPAFPVHDHFERYKDFKVKAGGRVALNFRGDMFDPERDDETIREHFTAMGAIYYGGRDRWLKNPMPKVLIQTRHIERAVRWSGCFEKWNIEIGTSYCSPADRDNILALSDLPAGVVRFVAFEPCDGLTAEDVGRVCKIAKPAWCYIGPKDMVPRPFNRVALPAWLSSFREAALDCGVHVIMKRKCGPELWALNEGVVL